MKIIINKITILIILITTFSCQEVVDVDLETSQERLVIEALIKWENGTTGNEQTIKLTKTSSFYNNQAIYAIGATVKVKNTTTIEEFIFTESTNGIYQTNSFVPILNNDYELTITYNNETYQGVSTLFEAPEILGITQSIDGGFTDEAQEINIFFQDFINQEDYYRIVIEQFRPSTNEVVNHDFFTYDARFEENNIIEGFYEEGSPDDDDFEENEFQINDEFDIAIYKISERFYNFIEILEAQADADFGPFASPPVDVKGNIVNQTESNNYPYGYFSLNEINKTLYVFQ
jgi:hypothetical protein